MMMEATPVVDINKLRYLTKNLPKSTITEESIDFSEFAAKSFEQTAPLTQPQRSKKSKRHSKWLYNEVQRNSINFGVSPEQMIEFHNQRKRESYISKQHSASSSYPNEQKSNPSVGSLESNQYSFSNKENQHPNKMTGKKLGIPKENYSISKAPSIPLPPVPMNIESSSPTSTVYVTANATLNRTANGTPNGGPNGKPISYNQTPPRPKTIPPQLDLNDSQPRVLESAVMIESSNSQKSKSYKIHSDVSASSVSVSSGFNKLRRKNSLTSLYRKSSTNSVNNSNNNLRFRLSSPTLRRKNSQTSFTSVGSTPTTTYSRPSCGIIASKRECHSIEDTLLADADFNDFSIPKRSSVIHHKDNTFDFEKPFSRESSIENFQLSKSSNTSLRSPLLENINSARFGANVYKTNGHPRSPSSDLPITPTKLRQRHSVADIQTSPMFSGDFNSPLSAKSRRSVSTYGSLGSSPTRNYRRISPRTSLSDLKGSPIEKISEHEISHFQSPPTARNSWSARSP